MAEQKIKSSDTVRITSIIEVNGKRYEPNQLVKNLPDAQLKSSLALKQISACPAGIKYCQEELKAKVIDHTAKPQEEKAAK